MRCSRSLCNRLAAPAAGWVVLALAACSSGASVKPADGGGLVRSPPGTACDAGSQCDTGSCQGSYCCAASCQQDPAHPECTACDSKGACFYPTVSCQPASCDSTTSVATEAGQCHQGSCQAGQPQPCTPYGCNGLQCASACDNDQDCATGYQCVAAAEASPVSPAGSCLRKSGPGNYCHHDDDCGSNLCLHNVCCATACPLDPLHPECTTCDATGACQYPVVACQQGGCDANSNSYLTQASCGGLAAIDAGNACLAGEARDCGQFLCSAAGCSSECLASTDCVSGAFCLTIAGAGTCCPGFSSEAPIYVDIIAGDDTGCCGSDSTHPAEPSPTPWRWRSWCAPPARAMACRSSIWN